MVRLRTFFFLNVSTNVGIGRSILRCCYALLCPQACVLCGRRVVNDWLSPLCSNCLDNLEPLVPPYCPVCGVPVPGNILESGYPCTRCRKVGTSFDSARAWGLYAGQLRRVVQAFKFNGARRLAYPLAELMSACCISHFAEGEIDFLVPVPLHRNRLRERGFNQTEAVAARLGKMLEIPLFKGVARIRDTVSQVGLSLPARRKNLGNAFHVIDPDALKGKRVLLVDDVLTTGTTVGELSRELRRKSEVEFIGVLTVARVGLTNPY